MAKFVWDKSPLELRGHFENLAKNRALEIAEKVFVGVVERTPVRTGQLRASWRASLGSVDTSKVFHTDPASPLPPPIFPLKVVPVNSIIHISNSHKYVIPIEFGHSKQAPYGMVRVTLASLGLGVSVRG
jgi:hypothetical protein